MISWFVGWSPASGSVLSVEPAWDSLSLALSLPLPLPHSCKHAHALFLSKKQNKTKQKNHNKVTLHIHIQEKHRVQQVPGRMWRNQNPHNNASSNVKKVQLLWELVWQFCKTWDRELRLRFNNSTPRYVSKKSDASTHNSYRNVHSSVSHKSWKAETIQMPIEW